jgi:hypothetical protein
MNNPIQQRPEMRELKRERETPFLSALHDETNDGTNMPIEDPDQKLSMIVLLLACLTLAAWAHVFI